MGFHGDDRGVTVQIGAVLLFGMLIISMSMYQATVVPSENEQVEYQHNQRVQEDMQSFRSAVTQAGSSELTRSVVVRLGTQYPERVLFVNPPAPAGTVRTDATASIEIRNAAALDSETADYWESDTKTFATSRVSYQPTYHSYQNAPTTLYESSVLYNQFDGGNDVLQSEQSLVDGRRINLVAVDGDLSQSQSGSFSVDVRPVSVSERTVTVGGSGSDRLTILVPSSLDVDTWQRLLASEIDSGGDAESDRYVESVTSGPGETIKLVFEPDYQYDLNLAQVGVGTNVAEPTSTYLTKVAGDDESVREGGEHRLTVEVRDAFNNPVSGQVVDASVTSGPGSVTASATSDSDGRAVFTYTPESSDGQRTATVTATFGSSPGAKERVQFDLSLTGDGGAATINPNAEDAVILRDSGIVEEQCDTGQSRYGLVYCQVDVQLTNLDEDTTRRLTDARLSFYDVDATNNNPPNAPQSAVLVRSGASDVTLTAANSGGVYERLNPPVDVGAGASAVLRFGFYADADATTAFDAEQGDFFVFSVLFEDGEAATYFVAPDVGDIDEDDSGSETGSGEDPKLSLRLDDHTGLNRNTPRYVLSYDVANTNGSFERVEASFENTNNPSADGDDSSTQTRGNLQYSNDNGAGATYDIRVDAVYRDSDGEEYVAASRTFSDVADARNWAENKDLSTDSSPTFTAVDVEDRSNTQQNRLAYRFDYDVSGPNFGQVQLAVVSQSSSGPTVFETSTAQSRNNVELSAGYETGTEYKVALLLYDSDGAVVDARIITDTADGDGP
ncbi:Ig-like domain-containing protein [Halogranum rubrum]|uniref:Big-1 domain-containing protein n=1 Tax=Halogranum salarium B-1 TaxID=1210908 RepID=J3JFL8_9EURY|nr:Ig-like domain-containing protein [Halogranum salarium]EJN59336.1 hypothetical protein HSB1_27570 [Halogranum salarium B-1]